MSGHSPDAAVRIEGFDAFRRIGNGGFSSVYSARQLSMGRDVAVKVLNADFGSDSDRRVFERECQALGLLSRHPNIVTVYSEAFTMEGRPCIVMELYHGNYRERLDSVGPVPIDELLALGIKVAGALQAAHDRGILHRDIKPHNIFQSDYGEPALGDFGISTIDDERSISGATGLSVAYAAPEVLEDARATASSDVYSLAATLFHLADGSAPFASAQLRSTVKRILTEAAPALTRPDAPSELSRALMRGLAKEGSERPPSAEAFAASLGDVQAVMGLARTAIPLSRSGGGFDQVLPSVPASGPAGPAVVSTPGGSEATPRDVRRGRQEPTVARRAGVPRIGQDGAESPSAGEAASAGQFGAPGSAATARESTGVVGSNRGRELAESTIVRQRAQPSVAEEPVEESGPSTTRRWVAIGLGAVAVGAVVGGLVLGGGGDGGERTASTTTAVTMPDVGPVVVVDVATPTEVAVTADAAGNAVLTFEAVPEAEQYLARSVFPSTLVDVQASSDTSVIETQTLVIDADCWVVVARAPGGQLSAPSDPVCVD